MRKFFAINTFILLIFCAISLSAQTKTEPKKDDAKKTTEVKPSVSEAKMVFDAPQKEGVKAICPVTGEIFVITKDTAHSEYKGKFVYYCCPSCKATFDKDPEKYLKTGTKKK
ncbi:MAG TPA: YHS domain-containing protein [bacterium]|nr:YHS domain-containing protein [bacterium]HPS29386.1 YHS domain-containing protein [bacterium]